MQDRCYRTLAPTEGLLGIGTGDSLKRAWGWGGVMSLPVVGSYEATVAGLRFFPCEGENNKQSLMNESLGMATSSRPSCRRLKNGSFVSSGFAAVVKR